MKKLCLLLALSVQIWCCFSFAANNSWTEIKQAAEQGDLEAQSTLGAMYYEEQDYEHAFLWLQRAADKGYAEAQTDLGILYTLGRGVPQDHHKAMTLFEQAAAQGDPDAMMNIARLYYFGRGIPQDDQQARQWMGKAAQTGEVAAQSLLGRSYLSGECGIVDYERAKYWLDKAAAQNDPNAEAGLGNIYYQGLGVPADHQKAVYWYEKSAAQGNIESQEKLGFIYLTDESTSYNNQQAQQARYWFEQAAVHGSESRMTCSALGFIYYLGIGGQPDYQKARYWSEKAAALGDVYAMQNLGDMYQTGLGVPQDDAQAKKWFELAAQHDDQPQSELNYEDNNDLHRYKLNYEDNEVFSIYSIAEYLILILGLIFAVAILFIGIRDWLYLEPRLKQWEEQQLLQQKQQQQKKQQLQEAQRKQAEEQLRKTEEQRQQEATSKSRQNNAASFPATVQENLRSSLSWIADDAEIYRLCQHFDEYKQDSREIVQYLKNHNIRWLYHFTACENLESIRKHGGLFSWDFCEKHGLVIPQQGGTELSRQLDRRKGLEDYVRLSFCYDHPMKYRLEQQGVELIMLKIDLGLVKFESTLFSNINAAANGVLLGKDLSFIKQHVDLAATQQRYVRRDSPEFGPHQAEVLIKTFVPLRYIQVMEQD